MITELRARHALLSILMGKMQDLIGTEQPQRSVLLSTRLMLTRASVARGSYINEVVVPALLAQADGAMATDIRALVIEAPELRARSSIHIATWTNDAVTADWAGYRRAATDILKMMAKRVAREKAALYPPLEQMRRAIPAGQGGQPIPTDLLRPN